MNSTFLLWYTYCILRFLEELSQQIIIEDEWHMLHTIEEVPNLLWEYKTNNITRKTTRCNNSSGYCCDLAHTNKEISSQKYFSTPPPPPPPPKKNFLYLTKKQTLLSKKFLYLPKKQNFQPKAFFLSKEKRSDTYPQKTFFFFFSKFLIHT